MIIQKIVATKLSTTLPPDKGISMVAEFTNIQEVEISVYGEGSRLRFVEDFKVAELTHMIEFLTAVRKEMIGS